MMREFLRRISAVLGTTLGVLVLLAIVVCNAAGDEPENVYHTYGVHNDAHRDDCAYPTCIYSRGPTEPTDPTYPRYWTSRWAMYRVFNDYQTHLPPYAGAPPLPLREGVDYQKSWGTTYYDSEWKGSQGNGAMEEHYEKYCLPIFPFANNYTCSFISLGETAFFVTYDDRPSWMEEVCLFSPHNHPPERDFIKHLPYAVGDSRQLNFAVQGYSFWVSQSNAIMQTGAAPDQTQNGGILFGYAFDSQPTPDRVDKNEPPYRHPQSFYFSGIPRLPQAPLPNAPIVSQNYTDFAMVRPDPATTWAQVESLDPAKLPACHLFDHYQPPAAATPEVVTNAPGAAAKIPSWGTIGQH
jgi:hypothetical protein